MKKLSLIVPCYNSSEYLSECYDSIKRQTAGLDDVEIIFVDDASTDGGRTVEMLGEFQKELPDRIRIVRHETNKRQGGSRNTGIRNAEGEYIGFVDADDHLSEDYLEKTLAAAYENDADIVQFGHYEYIKDENGQQVMVREMRMRPEVLSIDSVEKRKEFVMFGQMTPGHWDKIYRRSLVAEAGVAFRENSIYEEPQFTYPLRYYVNRFVALEDCLNYNYLRSDSGMRTEMKRQDKLKDNLDQNAELVELMKNSPFYATYSDEIEFNFIHSYIVETMIFAAKNKSGLSLDTYEKMRKKLFSVLGRNIKNVYVTPTTLHYTLLNLMEKDGMTQKAVDEVLAALSQL